MADQIIAGGLRAELRFTLMDEQVMNTLWFHKEAGEVATADCQAIGDTLADWWRGYMKPLLTSSITLREVYVRGADFTTGNPEYTSTVGLPATGDVQLESMPGNVALCVSFRTGLTGRSFRGRNYISGMNDGVVSGNQFQTSFVNNVVLAYTEIAGNVPSGFTWGVASFQTNGVANVPGLFHPIQSVLATDVNVDSMRSRLAGRGR